MTAPFQMWILYEGYHKELTFNWKKIKDRSLGVSHNNPNRIVTPTGFYNPALYLNSDFGILFDRFRRYYDEYFSITGELDHPYFKLTKSEFIRHFPLTERIKGVRYFDEMIDELIHEYETILSQQKQETKETVEEMEEYDFPEIFAKNGFQTIKMLNEKYTKDDKKLKAKYSNLFWFLESEDLLRCTQLEYKDFIEQKYSVKLSKILPRTTKYEDIIQPLLMRYYKGQQ